MEERSALLWEVQTDDVDFTGGVFVCKLNAADQLTFKEMAGEMAHTGGTITCSASDVQGDVGPQLAGNIVDVEVDPDTGKVEILRYTNLHGRGLSGSPKQRRGVEARRRSPGRRPGVERGVFLHRGRQDGKLKPPRLSHAHDNRPAHDRHSNHRGPVPNPRHPFGIRGVGESPIVPPLAAIANAIHDATGVQFTKLPMSPSSIVKALGEKNGV